MCQIPAQGPAAGLPCALNQIVTNAEIELVSRLEVRVAGHVAQRLGGPAYGEFAGSRGARQERGNANADKELSQRYVVCTIVSPLVLGTIGAGGDCGQAWFARRDEW